MLKSVLLSHDLPITEHHGEKLPSASKDRSLEEAICLFERILQANGKIDGGEDDMDRSEQFQHIEAEARRLSILYDGLEPHVQGGREHDLTHDGESATV